MTVPTIETERLILRPQSLGEFEAYAALWSNPALTRYIGGVPMDREASWGRMLRVAGLWQLLGFGFLAVEEKQSGRLLGEVGFQDMRRGFTPSIEDTLETGWALDPAAHGRGYATEAVSAMIRWAQASLPPKTMTCIIHPDNTPSLRVATKLGFVETARTDYRGPIVVLTRPSTRD